MNNFILVAHAAPENTTETPVATETHAETTAAHTEVAHSEGLSIQPTTVAFQALNFAVLLFALHAILYKPIIKLLNDREKKIKDGVENAEKAELSLKEATLVRQDMLKNAKVETQTMMEHARKSGEDMKATMTMEAQDQAKKIIESGHAMVEMEKGKTMQELKTNAVNLIVKAAEKVLREKIDPTKDMKMIEEHLHNYSA